MVEALIAVAGLALLIAAMRHAANASELVLGSTAILGIGVAWGISVVGRRRESAAVVRDTPGFMVELRLSRARQLRLARFVWLVLMIELTFLARWWVGGIQIHRHDASSLLAVVTLWTPIIVIVSLGAWATRLTRRARRELLEIERAEAGFVSDGTTAEHDANV